jgi:hypothetical protein
VFPGSSRAEQDRELTVPRIIEHTPTSDAKPGISTNYPLMNGPAEGRLPGIPRGNHHPVSTGAAATLKNDRDNARLSSPVEATGNDSPGTSSGSRWAVPLDPVRRPQSTLNRGIVLPRKPPQPPEFAWDTMRLGPAPHAPHLRALEGSHPLAVPLGTRGVSLRA